MRRALIVVALAALAVFSPPAAGEQDAVGWMASKLLTGKDILDWELALKKFVTYTDPRVLPTLMKVSESSEVLPRAETAGVLWHYNDKEVRERLLQLTKDSAPAVRIEAAKSLCLMNYTASLPLVTAELKASAARVRARALRALAAVKGEASVKAVKPLRSSKFPIDQIWSAFALYQLGVEPDKQITTLQKHLLSAPAAAWLPAKKDPEETDLQRAAKLGAAKLPLRLEASQALHRIGDEKALKLLVQATGDLALAENAQGPRQLLLRHGDQAAAALASAGLTSDKALVRLGSAQTAGRLRLGSDTAKNALGESLGKAVGDEAGLVRAAAIRAIASLEIESQLNRIFSALNHADPKTRREAARALGILGGKSSVEPLIKKLGNEKKFLVRRAIYQAIARLRSPSAVDPMFEHLKLLYKESRQSSRVDDEIPLCLDALAAGGDAAATKALESLPRLKGAQRKLMVEVLARSGSAQGIEFFTDELRESPPDPDGPAVRFFSSLDRSFASRLEEMIGNETAMWIRVILARSLFKMGKSEYSRGILWGLKNKDPYLRKLAAALCAGVDVPGSVQPLIALLDDAPGTAAFAARALLSLNQPEALKGLVENLDSESLRKRRSVPISTFWEGRRSATHPFAKEVDNERVWVVFADDRMGRKMDLFLTWSVDGRVWKEPVFTGLTSFADPEGNVPPPTFSLKVRGRDITIALTRTFAQSANPKNPRFKTLQRVHKYKLKSFFRDKDGDELPDIEEKALKTKPHVRDTDGDGVPDGRDKNPLGRPARLNRDGELLKVLAFSHVFLLRKALPEDARLLVVTELPDERRTPELPTFPGLVLHLNREQIRSLWKSTGGGFPRIHMGPAKYSADKTRAVQPIAVVKGIDDKETMKVRFVKREGQWVVTGYVE
jgi:HEAT repeat protein